MYARFLYTAFILMLMGPHKRLTSLIMSMVAMIQVLVKQRSEGSMEYTRGKSN